MSLQINDCKVVGYQISDDKAYYVIQVTPQTGETWYTKKRYSHFEDFHSALLDCISLTYRIFLFLHPYPSCGTLSSYYSKQLLPAGAELPGKKIPYFTSHLAPSLLEERSILLQNYLRKIISVSAISTSPLLVNFLQMDTISGGYTPTRTDPAEVMYEFEFPDDAEVTEVSLPQTRTMTDHVLYQIDAANAHQRKSFQKWTVLKRFASFVDMDTALREEFIARPDVLAELPAPPEKHYKIVYDHLNFHFVEQRRAMLEAYLQRLVVIEPVLYSSVFLSFLGVNY